MAYLLQALLILGSCIASLHEQIPIETIELIDYLFCIVLGSIWIIFTLFYVSMRFKTFRDCYDSICCKCCCLGRVNYNDWSRRGDEEINGWIINDTQAVEFDPDNVK